MKPLRQFILRVKHDRGIVNIHTAASSADAARNIVMTAERCPERSILETRCVDDKGFELDGAGDLLRLAVPADQCKRTEHQLRRPASGYGKRVPTDWMVQGADQRWRRVYCAIFSNIGTTYIERAGIKTVVNLEIA